MSCLNALLEFRAIAERHFILISFFCETLEGVILSCKSFLHELPVRN